MRKKKQRALQVIIVSGPRDIDRAVLGFAFATSAAVSNIKVAVVLSMQGTAWAKSNQPAARREISGLGSIRKFVNILTRSGATIGVCSACLHKAAACACGAPLDLPAVGLLELTAKACRPGVSTVVF